MNSVTQLTNSLVGLAPFILVGFIVWARFQQKLMQHQRKLTDTTAEASAEKAAQYVAQNRELAERVGVLERIVTDRGYDVAVQIEALRDTHRVDTLRADLDSENKDQREKWPACRSSVSKTRSR